MEVDIRASGWHAHGHDRNPAFHNVILHVVWDATTARLSRSPCVLSLRHALDAPLGELSLWLECESPESLPENLRGKCSTPLTGCTDAQLTSLLREAAQVRFQAKAAQLRARARQAGWEQALWEGLFRGLGYKHNVWPMQCLAETRPHWAGPGASPLGVAGASAGNERPAARRV